MVNSEPGSLEFRISEPVNGYTFQKSKLQKARDKIEYRIIL
jgi:hypothetical protein